jgi:hypothetical protein
MFRRVLTTLAICLLLSASAVVLADDYVWTGSGDGVSWDGTGNWTGGLFDYPDSYTDNAFIAGDGFSALINGDTGDYDGEIRGDNAYLSHGDYADGGALEIATGGLLDLNGGLYFGGLSTTVNGNDGVLNMNGGTLNAAEIFSYGSGHQLNLNSGTISLTGQLKMGMVEDSDDNVTVINVSGGTLNATHLYLGRIAGSGSHDLNMTGGTLNLSISLTIPGADVNSCHVQFDGGTMNIDGASNCRLAIYKDWGGSMDMRNDATVIIGRDWVSNINGYIATGCLTAYGGQGTVLVDYGVTHPGKTTIVAKKADEPIPSPTEVYWTAGGDGSSWHDGSNWNGGVFPNSSVVSAAIAGEGLTAVIDSTTGSVSLWQLFVSHKYFAPSGGTLNIEADGVLNCAGGFYLGGDSGGTSDANNGILNVNGGTLNSTEIRSYGNGQQVNLTGGTINLINKVEMGMREDANDCTSNFNISDGVLNATHIYLGRVANGGTHSLTMTGGTVNLGIGLVLPGADNTTGYVQFDGGTINIGTRLSIYNHDNWQGSMDMRNDAKVIINADFVDNIETYIAEGSLTSYGGTGGFSVDYGVTSSGKTTVTVCNIPADLNRDCVIDAFDLGVFAEHWLSDNQYVDEKLFQDGTVDFADFALLAEDLTLEEETEPNTTVYILNPYEDVNWVEYDYVCSTSHMHVTRQTVLDTAYAGGLRHLPFSNYYPSAPYYPLEQMRKDQFKVQQDHAVVVNGQLQQGPFNWNDIILDVNTGWYDQLAPDLQDDLPFQTGDYIFTNIPSDVLGAPNAEHHSFTNTDAHINSLGSTFASGTFDVGGPYQLGSHGYARGCPISWQQAFDLMLAELQFPTGGGITINHPVWSGLTNSQICQMLDYDERVLGLEIYNQSCQEGTATPGNGWGLELWDEILSTGRKCYGFSVPDHKLNVLPWKGRNYLLVSEFTELECLDAYRQGRFYCAILGTGLRFDEISLVEGELTVKTNMPALIKVISNNGVVETTGSSFAYTVPFENTVYIRVEAEDDTGERIFSQPIMFKI